VKAENHFQKFTDSTEQCQYEQATSIELLQHFSISLAIVF